MAVPTDISGLVNWLKADSLGLADGTAVATWTDSSGSGNSGTAAGTAQPTFKTGILNSLPVVRFNGTTNVMALPNAITTQTSVFIVYTGSSGSGSLISQLNASGAWLQRNTAVWVNANQASLVITPGINSHRLYAQTFDYTGSSFNVYIEGTNAVTSSTAYTSFVGAGVTYEIGARNGNSEFFTGDIAEVIIYSRILTTLERAQVDTYISNKYAITVSDLIASSSGSTMMMMGV